MKTVSIGLTLLLLSGFAIAQTLFPNSNFLASPSSMKNVAANLEDSNAAGLELYTVDTNIAVFDGGFFTNDSAGAYFNRDGGPNGLTNKADFWCYYSDLSLAYNTEPACSNAAINTTTPWLPGPFYSHFYVTVNADMLNSVISGSQVENAVTRAKYVSWDIGPGDFIVDDEDGDGNQIKTFAGTNGVVTAQFNGTSGEFSFDLLNVRNAQFQTNGSGTITPSTFVYITNNGQTIKLSGEIVP